MGSGVADRGNVEGGQADRAALKLLDEIFSRSAVQVKRRPKLQDAEGNSIDLPDELFEVLRKVVHILKKGDMVSIVPVHHELTTQQAAEILNVSRPHLISLLEAGALRFTKTGKHRRIRTGDLFEYKNARDQERRSQLAELTRAAEEAGEY
jgi:excisionase family DNA binding protein